MDKGLAFVIPMIFEFQNTSNTTRVIRDVSLILCNDENFVAKMIQIDHIVSTKKTGNTVTDLKDTFLGEKNGSYSFVLPPRSIQKQKCEYLHTFEPSRPNEYGFNKLVLRYFDESNKAHYFEIKDLSDLWDVKQYKVDKECMYNKECALAEVYYGQHTVAEVFPQAVDFFAKSENVLFDGGSYYYDS